MFLGVLDGGWVTGCVSAMVSTDLEVNIFETNGAKCVYTYISKNQD